MQPARPEAGCELTRVDPALQLLRTALPVEGRPASGCELAVEEDRERQLAADLARDLERRLARASHVLRPYRDDRHDVGRADPRVRTEVVAQVDAIACAGDPRDERVHQLLLLADEREHRTVVVDVGVHVEHACVRAQRGADGVDHRAVTPLGEIGNGLERQPHGRKPTLSAR